MTCFNWGKKITDVFEYGQSKYFLVKDDEQYIKKCLDISSA